MDIVLLSCLGIVVFIYCFGIFRGFGSKKLFNVPWYFIVKSLDIGGAKGRYYRYKNVVGVPDAVFKHPILPYYIVGEAKGRQFKNHVRPHERYQLQIYVGMIKSKTIGKVRGVLRYKDQCIDVPHDKTLFKNIIKQRRAAINALTSL